MQKIYLKYKDKWWAIPIGLFISVILKEFFVYLIYFCVDLIKKIPLTSIYSSYADSLFKLLNLQIPLFLIIVWLLALILGFNAGTYIFNKLLEIFSGKNKLKILKANYGFGNKFIDITNELNSRIINNNLREILSNTIAGDPNPGKRKNAIIRYKFQNKELDKSYTEGDTIELP